MFQEGKFIRKKQSEEHFDIITIEKTNPKFLSILWPSKTKVKSFIFWSPTREIIQVNYLKLADRSLGDTNPTIIFMA